MKPIKDNNSFVSEEKFDFDHFVQRSPDLICIASYDGFFKKINPAVAKTLGYTEEELLAKPINDFIYPADKIATMQSREDVKRSIPILNFENRYLTKSGEVVWLSWTSVGIDGPKLIFGLAKNITHKKKLEEDRNILFANLNKTNNDLKQLTFTAAHDLRSPVNNLLAIYSMIESHKVEDQEVLELLNYLKLSTENIKNTLNHYVDVLIQKESLNIPVSEISFLSALHTTQLSLKSLISDTNTNIIEDFSEIDRVYFNKSYLNSIFLNLISNAIKYAKPNTYPQIYLRTQKGDGFINLIFTDNGMGFEMEKVKDRIFGFNQTFHNNKDGKGIGLYLVNNYLTSLGGRIEVQSKVNEGTEFTLSFKV